MKTIGQLAASAEVGVETVRFYQRKGLLRVPHSNGGIRRYGHEDLRRLRFIRKAQTAGFRLVEIAELLELDASDDRPRARELARQRIDALETLIQELSQAKKSLQRLERECSTGKVGPCPILAAFEQNHPGN